MPAINTTFVTVAATTVTAKTNDKLTTETDLPAGEDQGLEFLMPKWAEGLLIALLIIIVLYVMGRLTIHSDHWSRFKQSIKRKETSKDLQGNDTAC
jgi:hypothetical protein